LAQSITISGRTGTVVRRAVAFDPQYVFSRPRWIDNTKVYPKSFDTDLRVNMEAALSNCASDSFFEGALEFATV
jgi:hypothetical protein